MTLQYYSDRIDVCKAAVSISGISVTYVLNKSLGRHKKLESYAQGDNCYASQNKKRWVSKLLLQWCFEMWRLLCTMSTRLGFTKVWVWKEIRLWAIKNSNNGWASTSVYETSWEGYYTHKISCVWRREQIDKEHPRLYHETSSPLRWCNALW